MSQTKCGNLYILGKETHVQVDDTSKFRKNPSKWKRWLKYRLIFELEVNRWKKQDQRLKRMLKKECCGSTMQPQFYTGALNGLHFLLETWRKVSYAKGNFEDLIKVNLKKSWLEMSRVCNLYLTSNNRSIFKPPLFSFEKKPWQWRGAYFFLFSWIRYF